MNLRDTIECETCKNCNCFIKQYCSPGWLGIISKSKGNIRCNKGQSIILEGSPVMGIYFIYQGKVKVTISGANDKEQIVRLAKEGHILGHRGYGGESYPIGAEALEDSSICFVTNELLYDTFITNPEFTYHLMMFYSKELRKSEQRIKYLAQMNVREKVAFALIYLVDTFGLNQTEKTLNIALSRNEIGSIIGINADQVSREISKLKKDNVLNTKGNKIIINNFDQLQEIIADFPYYS